MPLPPPPAGYESASPPPGLPPPPEGYEPQDNSPSYAADIGKGIVGGAMKGAYGRVGFGGDIRQAIEGGIEGLHGIVSNSLGLDPQKQEELRAKIHNAVDTSIRHLPLHLFSGPTSEEFQRAIERRTGAPSPPEAETTPGQYAQTGAQFVVGGAGMGGIPGKIKEAVPALAKEAVKYGLIPAAASETAGQLTQGTATEPYARGIAAFGGAALPAAVEHFRPSSVEQAVGRQLPANVTPEIVTKAESLMQDAQARGVNLTWPEALSQVTGSPTLTNTQRVVESAPQSRTAMDEFMAQRPGQIQAAAQDTFAKIAPKTNVPSTIGPAVGEAADQEIGGTRKTINKITEPLYKESEGFLLNQDEMDRVLKIPGFMAAADKVSADPQLSRYVKDLPRNSVGFLNEVKKVLDQDAINETRPANTSPNMQRRSGLEQDAAEVSRVAQDASLRQGSTAYPTALAVQAHARETYLQPLLDGPLGQLAQRDINTQRAIDTIFPKSGIPGSENEIADAISRISQRNPRAAQLLVRAHLEQKLDESFNAGGRGQEASQFAGAGFASRVAGSPTVDTQKFENLKSVISALPDGAQKWEGFQRFLDIARATGTRMPKGSMTAFNEREMQMLSTSGGGVSLPGIVKEAASPERWLNAAHEYISHWQQGRNLKGLAALLTDPGAGDTFRKIASTKPDSRNATLLVARLMAQTSPIFNQPGQQQKPAQ